MTRESLKVVLLTAACHLIANFNCRLHALGGPGFEGDETLEEAARLIQKRSDELHQAFLAGKAWSHVDSSRIACRAWLYMYEEYRSMRS